MTDLAAGTNRRRKFAGLKAFIMTPRMGITLLVLLAMTVLIIPLPTVMIDIMVSINLLLALYLMLKTLYVKDSLELTTFPSLLLLTTVFRLAVSIATTRAILATGDGGEVIRSFGEFVVSGSVVVGLVVFLVISIVQFLVITKGGERVAEVSARFVLDALPGKQMSIDADLKAGDITREEARARRKRLQSESEFFGSMDGAMRFVKGDCIATMVIVAVNLIGGILIGVAGKGMSLEVAAKTYSILTIGDGLVAQIPSILSSIAAGILSTRVNAEEASTEGLGGDIASQLLGENRSLIAAGTAIGVMGLVPGFPALILVPMGVLILLFAFLPKIRGLLSQARRNVRGNAGTQADGSTVPQAAQEPLPAARFNDAIRVVGRNETLSLLQRAGLGTRIQEILVHQASFLGFALHSVKFVADATAREDVLDVYLEGVLSETIPVPANTDMTVVMDELVRISRGFSAKAFSVDDAGEWLDLQARVMPKLVASITQQVPLPLLAGVLRLILRDGITISHPRALLEELLLAVESKFTADELAEAVRPRLLSQILARNTDADGRVRLVEIGEGLESLLSTLGDDDQADLSEFDRREDESSALISELRTKLNDLARQVQNPVLVVPGEIRSVIARRLAEFGCNCNVISVAETDHVRAPARLDKIDLQPTDSEE